MIVQFLLFVIAVLLFVVVFGELCKIKSQLKRILDPSPKMSEEGRHTDVAVTPRTVG